MTPDEMGEAQSIKNEIPVANIKNCNWNYNIGTYLK